MKIALAGLVLLGALGMNLGADSRLSRHQKAMQEAQGVSVKFRISQADAPAEDHTLSLSKPNAFRWESPSKVVVSDGTKLTTFDKNARLYQTTEATPELLAKTFETPALWAYHAFFDAKWTEQITSEKVGAEMNQKGKLLTQVVLGRKAGLMTLYVEQATGLVFGGSYLMAGKPVYIQVSDLQVSPKTLDSKLFAWVPPADATETAGPKDAPAMLTFSAVKPIFDANCVSCHGGPNPTRGLNLSSYESIMRSGAVKAGNPGASSVVRAITSGVMPPRNPLRQADIDLITKWVADGANP